MTLKQIVCISFSIIILGLGVLVGLDVVDFDQVEGFAYSLVLVVASLADVSLPGGRGRPGP